MDIRTKRIFNPKNNYKDNRFKIGINYWCYEIDNVLEFHDEIGNFIAILDYNDLALKHLEIVDI